MNHSCVRWSSEEPTIAGKYLMRVTKVFPFTTLNIVDVEMSPKGAYVKTKSGLKLIISVIEKDIEWLRIPE